MFTIKKMGFEVQNLKVEIPEDIGVYLDTNYSIGDYSFSFMSAKDGYRIDYDLAENRLGTKEEFLEYQTNLAERAFPIEEIEINGFNGYHSTFYTKKEQHYEIRFLIDETEDGYNEFRFALTAENNIEDIKSSETFKKFLNGISKKTDL